MQDYFRPYKKGDLPALWDNLRAEDLSELQGLGINNPALVEQHLGHTQTWDTPDGPVACLGVTPTDEPGVGLVWALAAEAARPRWRFAVRNTQAVLDEIGSDYLILTNFKDARNKGQVRWLRRVGFTFINRVPLGNREYLQFVRIMK